MASKMLKERYFYPTNLFIAKYDTILHDFSCICQIKCLKCKLLHFIFKLLEERRKFKLACALLFLVLHTVYTCGYTSRRETVWRWDPGKSIAILGSHYFLFPTSGR